MCRTLANKYNGQLGDGVLCSAKAERWTALRQSELLGSWSAVTAGSPMLEKVRPGSNPASSATARRALDLAIVPKVPAIQAVEMAQIMPEVTGSV